MLEQVSIELNEFPFMFEGIPFEALRKLKFAGGKEAARVLVDALGRSSRMSHDAKHYFGECMQSAGINPTSDQVENARKSCVARGYFWPIEHRTKFILAALAEMVDNPPLPADAPPNPESFRQWKEWWEGNKDHAIFVHQHVQPLE